MEPPVPCCAYSCRRLLLALVWLLALAAPAGAQASSVVELPIDDLATSAELVFEGRVVGQRVEQGQHARDIYTLVTFEVLDVVAGRWAQPTIDLAFSGGRLGHLAMEVSDMRIPAVGEHGVYFVERLDRRQVNPLLGWTQGHFLVSASPGQRGIVRTAVGRPVFSIEARPSAVRRGLSTGTAPGVLTSPQIADEAPMDVETFKARLRELTR